MISFKKLVKVKKFKLSVSIIMCCFLFVNSTNCLACDMVLNAKEENYLFCYNSIKNACQGSDYKNANCSKYLVRYDGLASKIDAIKKIVDEKDSVSRTKILEKAGILTAGAVTIGAGIYFAPITTMIASLGFSLGLPAVCIAHNEIIKPSGKVAGYIPKFIIEIIGYFTGGNSNQNPDVGMIGNAIIAMCGNSSKENKNEGILEGIRKLIFGEKISEIREDNEKEAYKKILNEFYKQVKERKFEGNNILMYCIDSTDVNNVKSDLKFEHTFSNLGRYPNDIEDYFKEWLK